MQCTVDQGTLRLATGLMCIRAGHLISLWEVVYVKRGFFIARHYTFVDFTVDINNKNTFPWGKRFNTVVLKEMLQNALIYNISNNYLRSVTLKRILRAWHSALFWPRTCAHLLRRSCGDTKYLTKHNTFIFRHLKASKLIQKSLQSFHWMVCCPVRNSAMLNIMRGQLNTFRTIK